MNSIFFSLFQDTKQDQRIPKRSRCCFPDAFLILVLFHGGVFSKSRLPLVYRRPQDLSPPSVELTIRLSCLGFTLSPLSGAAAYYIIGSRSWKTL